MLKRTALPLFCLVILTSLVVAQNYKIEVSTLQETFEAGKNITFKVSLFDSQNNPVNDFVFVTLEDAEKNIKIEKEVPSNEIVEINLGEGVSYGQGTITASYKDAIAFDYFTIEINELANFELRGDILVVTNIGNTRYTKTIQITIGDTVGTKSPKIDIGKSVSYRLVAPDGSYNVKVTDGKTTLTQSDVRLTGTGQVIGALDQSVSQRSSITGGIRPEDESEEGLLGYIKGSTFIYIFVLVIFGAMILLVIERRFRKKIRE